MINKPMNWDSVQIFTERRKLPVDAYVCKIMKAVVKDTVYGNQLCLLFDITLGEYANFYADDYQANTQQDKKWKGVLRQFLPKDDGSQKDEWTKSSFKTLLEAVETSNRGYVWDWDERSLEGKEIGIIYRNEEWSYNGKTGWAARPFRPCSIDTVIDGSYTIPDDKPLKSKTTGFGGYPSPADNAASTGNFAELTDDDSDLPF